MRPSERNRIEEHTCNQQQNVEHEQNDVLVRGQAQHRFCEQLRNVAAGQHEAEGLHTAEDQHDGAGTNGRIDKDSRNILQLEGLVNPLAANKTIHTCDCAGLGGRKESAVIPPIAAVVAGEEPEIAAKNALAAIVT